MEDCAEVFLGNSKAQRTGNAIQQQGLPQARLPRLPAHAPDR
jgi:hypothetical protein